MLLSLIGMSGSGKSFWSAKLAGIGYKRFCCDDLITDRLAFELKREDGSAMSLGEWMGFPFQPGYERKEEVYLACEKEVVSDVLEWLETNACGEGSENVVVDTTGSVIYTGENLLARLRSLTTTVNFTNPPEIRDAMLREYRANPRPVLWRGLFSRQDGESDEAALLRSYNLLLDERERLYLKTADIEIDYRTRSRAGFGIDDFLEIVKKSGAKDCPQERMVPPSMLRLSNPNHLK